MRKPTTRTRVLAGLGAVAIAGTGLAFSAGTGGANAASPLCVAFPRVVDTNTTDSTLSAPLGRILVDHAVDKVKVQLLLSTTVAGSCDRSASTLLRWKVYDAAGAYTGQLVKFDGTSDTQTGDAAEQTFSVDRFDTLGTWQLRPYGVKRLKVNNDVVQSLALVPTKLRTKAVLTADRPLDDDNVVLSTRVTVYSQLGDHYLNDAGRSVQFQRRNASGAYSNRGGLVGTNAAGKAVRNESTPNAFRYRSQVLSTGTAWEVTSNTVVE